MRVRIFAAFILLYTLVGCDNPAPKLTEQEKYVEMVWRAIVQYQVMNGSEDEQKKEPITDEQVTKLQEYIKTFTD